MKEDDGACDTICLILLLLAIVCGCFGMGCHIASYRCDRELIERGLKHRNPTTGRVEWINGNDE